MSEGKFPVVEVYLKQTGYSTSTYKTKVMILTNTF